MDRTPVFRLKLPLLLLGLQAFLLPFVILPSIEEFSELPKLAFVQLGAVALVLVWLHQKGRLPRFEWRRLSALDAVLIAALFWAGLSVFWAHSTYDALLRLVHWSTCALIFFVARDRLDERAGRYLFSALVASGVLVAGILFLQDFFGYSGIPQGVAPASTLGNKNLAGEYLLMVLPLCAFFVIAGGSRVLLATGLVSGCLILFGIVQSTCKAAWLGVFVQAVVLLPLLPWLLKSRGLRIKRAHVLAVVLIGVVFLAGLGLVYPRFSSRVSQAVAQLTNLRQTLQEAGTQALQGKRLDDPAVVNSLTIRVPVWRNTLEMVRDYPALGVGLNNFFVYYPRYHLAASKDFVFSGREQWYQVHNDYLQLFAEIGIPGLALFLGAGVLLFARAIRVLTSPVSAERKLLTILAGVSLVGLAVDAVFAFPFQLAIPPYMAALFAAVIVGLGKAPEVEAAQPRKRDPFFFPVVGLTAVCLILLGFLHQWTLNADWYYRKAGLAGRTGNLGLMVGLAGQGFELNPWDCSNLFLLARGHLELGNWETAFKYSNLLLSRRPYYINALHNEGTAYLKKGDRASAMKDFERVLAIQPDYPPTCANLAELYASEGNAQKALECWRKAAEADPKNVAFWLSYGKLALDRSSLVDAESAFKQLTNLEPNKSAWRVMLGITHLRREDARQAELSFRQAIALNPQDLEACFRLGSMLYLRGSAREEASSLLQRVVTINPRHPLAAYAKAILEGQQRTTQMDKKRVIGSG